MNACKHQFCKKCFKKEYENLNSKNLQSSNFPKYNCLFFECNKLIDKEDLEYLMKEDFIKN